MQGSPQGTAEGDGKEAKATNETASIGQTFVRLLNFLKSSTSQSTEVQSLSLEIQKHKDLVTMRDLNNHTALQVALMQESTSDKVLMLLQHTFIAQTKFSSIHRWPLHVALEYNPKEEIVVKLLDLHPDAVKERDLDGRMPLNIALEQTPMTGGLIAIARRLLEKAPQAAEVRSRDRLPLHLCLQQRFPASLTLEVLKAHRCAAGVPDQEGRYPLHLAVMHRVEDRIVQELLNAFPEALIRKIHFETGTSVSVLEYALMEKLPSPMIKLLATGGTAKSKAVALCVRAATTGRCKQAWALHESKHRPRQRQIPEASPRPNDPLTVVMPNGKRLILDWKKLLEPQPPDHKTPTVLELKKVIEAQENMPVSLQRLLCLPSRSQHSEKLEGKCTECLGVLAKSDSPDSECAELGCPKRGTDFKCGPCKRTVCAEHGKVMIQDLLRTSQQAMKEMPTSFQKLLHYVALDDRQSLQHLKENMRLGNDIHVCELFEIVHFALSASIASEQILSFLDSFPLAAKLTNSEGVLPLHLAVTNKVPYGETKTGNLLNHLMFLYPQAVELAADELMGKYLLHLALENQGTSAFVKKLLQVAEFVGRGHGWGQDGTWRAPSHRQAIGSGSQGLGSSEEQKLLPLHVAIKNPSAGLETVTVLVNSRCPLEAMHPMTKQSALECALASGRHGELLTYLLDKSKKVLCKKCKEVMQELPQGAAGEKKCVVGVANDASCQAVRFSCKKLQCGYHLCQKHAKVPAVRFPGGAQEEESAAELSPSEASPKAQEESQSLDSACAISPLHIAVINNSGVPAIKQLLDHYRLALNQPDPEGRLPLHLACMKGQSGAVIRTLIKERSEVHARDGRGRTALQLAVTNKCLPGVVMELVKGDRVEKPVAKGSGSAKEEGEKEKMKEVLSVRDSAGRSVFELAVRADAPSWVMEELIESVHFDQLASLEVNFLNGKWPSTKALAEAIRVLRSRQKKDRERLAAKEVEETSAVSTFGNIFNISAGLNWFSGVSDPADFPIEDPQGQQAPSSPGGQAPQGSAPS